MNCRVNPKDRSLRGGKGRGQKDPRNTCGFEVLENRTLMSASTLAAPSALTAIGATTNTIQLHWKDNASTATGYNIFRSTDGVHYSLLTKLNSKNAVNYNDTTALSGHGYDYAIQATGGSTASAASNIAGAVAPLKAPTGLTARISGTSINLTWTDNDKTATGYFVLRSEDNVHFNLIATLAGGSAKSYSDTLPASGKTFYYKIEAFNTSAASAASASAIVTTPANPVSVTTRYGDELVVTADGLDDSISIL